MCAYDCRPANPVAVAPLQWATITEPSRKEHSLASRIAVYHQPSPVRARSPPGRDSGSAGSARQALG
jgi:hypothetical protein